MVEGMKSFCDRFSSAALKDRLGELTAPTGAEDTLVIDYPEVKDLRWQVNPMVAIRLLVVVVLVAIGFLGWQRFVKPPTVNQPFPLAAVAADSEVTAMSSGSLVVSVVGEVAHPGLHTLPPDARIADALAVAQPYPHGQTLGLNLAQKLADGQQIHVPHVDAEPVVPVNSATGEPVDATGGAKISLNSATVEQLQTLDGVGVKTAEAIIAYREAHGGFSDVAQLQEVKGIGPAKFAAISPEVSL